MLFIGEYNHALDSKSRMIVPAKLREGLGNRFVITKGLDGCLYAYPLEEWKILENKIKTLPLNNKMQEHLSDSFFLEHVKLN